MSLLPQYIGTDSIIDGSGRPRSWFQNFLNGSLKQIRDSIDSITQAQTDAANAQSAANGAQTTANGAQTTANGAQTTANAAQTAANTANATANAALTAATSNAAALATISNDNIITAKEKANTLISDAAQIETIYQQIIARANTLGISHSAADTSRSLWTAMLGSYSPAWNDTTQDTTIYTTALSTRNQGFPTGWNASGGATATASGAYVTLSDGSTTQYGSYNTDVIAFGAGQGLSAGIVVKKSASHTLNWIGLRVTIIVSGSTYYWDVVLNPYTGGVTGGGSPPSGSGQGNELLDLGSDWYINTRVVGCPTGTTGGYVTIYPVISGDGDTFTSYNATATGSTLIKGCPDVVQGDWWNLGRNELLGRYTAYLSDLKKLENLISAADASTSTWSGVSGTGKPEDYADVTRWVDGPPQSTIFHYDYTGTALSGEFSRDLGFKLLTPGGQITSGITWSYTVTGGTVNGFTSASGAQSMSGSGTGTLTISSLGSSTASVQVTASFGGSTHSAITPLSQNVAAPPTTSGGGTGGTTTLASQSPQYSVNSTTFTDITGTMAVTLPTGVTTVHLNGNITYTPDTTLHAGGWTVEQKWQRQISGTWTDVDTSPSTTSTSVDGGNGDPYNANAGSIRDAQTVSSLTAGTSYNFRIVARITSGTRSQWTSGTASITT